MSPPTNVRITSPAGELRAEVIHTWIRAELDATPRRGGDASFIMSDLARALFDALPEATRAVLLYTRGAALIMMVEVAGEWRDIAGMPARVSREAS